MPENLQTEQIKNMQLQFAQKVFDEINRVVTTNEQEKLCLLLPGITLTKSDYEYDVENDVKSTVVEANESKLANKLFNPYSLVAGDNGTTLPNQYLSALNLLTPKLNAFIAKSKNKLRELLMKRYPFTFENADGSTEYREDCTFQDVYFYLYTDYLNAAKEWADEQAREKKNRPNTSDYLKWYQDIADVRFNIINQKRAKILAIFSPNDMKILEGVLDSGSGAELQEARQLLNNLRKFNPDGGYTYPVKFYPSNWFEYLGTSFTPVDLLHDPIKLSDKLELLYTRRNTLISKIESLASISTNLDEVKQAAAEARAADNAYNEAFSNLAFTGEYAFFSFAKNVVKSICYATVSTQLLRDSCIPYFESFGKSELATRIVDAISDNMVSGASLLKNAEKTLHQAANNCVNKWANYGDLANRAQLKETIEMLKNQLIEINSQIDSLSNDMCLAVSRNSSTDSAEPPTAPKGFTQVLISHKNNYSTLDSDSHVDVTRESTTAGAWIFKYNSSSVDVNTSFNKVNTAQDTTIDIGMNVAKVAIERQWFNPGVFRLTKNMYNLVDDQIKVSLGPDGFKTKNLGNMSECVLPCFPTAMLVARDVTIKITAAESYDTQDLTYAYSESTTTHSYVFYHSSETTQTTDQSNHSTSYFDGKTITLKFAEPQVIGFYLQAVAEDESTAYKDGADDYWTITKFVETYKNLLDEFIKMNKQ